LVINAGSSSLKYQLVDMMTENVVAKGLCERINVDGRITHYALFDKRVIEVPLKGHRDAITQVLQLLTESDIAVVKDPSEIVAVGHRMAMGAEKMVKSCAITDEVYAFLLETIKIAPLHVPAMLVGVTACREVLPGVLQVAVFDTAFHHTMPPKAFMYGLPYELYKQDGFRKYGYHGTSFRYVTDRYSKLIGLPPEKLKLICCHIGNGISACAVEYGKSVDTSMGYTPLDGTMMGTRSGSIDPSLIFHIAHRKGLALEQVEDLLNKKSGYLGISGVSSDDRDLAQAGNQGHERSALAREMLCYQLKKYVGAYFAVLNGADALLFCGGMGERGTDLRAMICGGLESLGIILDQKRNISQNGCEGEISTPDSRVKIWIVPTNEELMIARDAFNVYSGIL
jgi:acetate kinase